MGPLHQSSRLTSPTSTFLHQTLLHPRKPIQHTQIRHATFIPRPRRPYSFTQLVMLSDGSTYLHRTSSPAPVYKSTKDTRNSQLWNPSSRRLMNIETDEAGRLRAFRSRFGRGWDSKRGKEIQVDAEGIEIVEGEEIVQKDAEAASEEPASEQEKTDAPLESEDNLLDLISSPEFDSGVVLGPKEKLKKRRKGRK